MITLRILKKKSKQAREILIAHYRYKPKDFFLAERNDNHHGLVIRCDHLKKPGRFTCNCSYHPLVGTPMTGEISGYYEPEWDERTALETLRQKVMWENRPATMTERDWRRTLAVTGTTPVTEADIKAWFEEDAEGCDELGEAVG